jgi:hypothetical protein
MAGLSGVIYAPNALLTASGNASLQIPLVVGMLNVSGNLTVTQTADGSAGAEDTSGLADTLLAGNLEVYISDPQGYFTSDELARIEEAVAGLDTLLAPFKVTITLVSDPALANLTLDTATVSAAGSAASFIKPADAIGEFGCGRSEHRGVAG